MAVSKVVDERHRTRGGGIARLELWQDDANAVIVKYSFAYVNPAICSTDDGRVVGFDNSHSYPGHASGDHTHWMGVVRENLGTSDPLEILKRFERALGCLKRHYGRSY